MHSRSEALRKIPKNVLERPFLDMIGFGKKVPEGNSLFVFDEERKLSPEEQETADQLLFDAVEKNAFNALKEALDKGANPDAIIGDKGRTIFAFAVKKETQKEILELLVKKASVDIKDNSGNTPLILAAANRRLEAIEILLANNASTREKNNSGKTALDIAQGFGYEKITELLKRHVELALGDEKADLPQDKKEKKMGLPDVTEKTNVPEPVNSPVMSTARNTLRLIEPIVGDLELHEEDQGKLNQKLLVFANLSDWDGVRRMLSKGALVDAKDNEGWTVLMFAAYAGDIAIARLVLEKGAEIDMQDGMGRTPLIHAARKGNTDMVAFLLKKNADVNIKTNLRETALSIAIEKSTEKGIEKDVEKRFKDIVQILNLKDAKTEKTLFEQQLMEAAEAGDIELAKKALKGGANIDAINRFEMTALMRASAAGHVEMIDFLLEQGAEKNLKNANGMTALMFAAGNGQKEAANTLISREASTSVKNRAGATARDLVVGWHAEFDAMITHAEEQKKLDIMLFPAIAMGYYDVVLDLIEKGANKDLKDDTGKTPLMQCIVFGHEELAGLLIEKMAKLEEKDKNGWTALKYAAAAGNIRIALKLISANAKVNEKDFYGRTPLMEAAYYGHDQMVDIMLSSGGKAKEQDNKGKDASDHAASRGHEGIAEKLRNAA